MFMFDGFIGKDGALEVGGIKPGRVLDGEEVDMLAP